VIRTLGFALAFVGALAVSGCDDDDNNLVVPDAPPFVVEGVRSITGDGQVTIVWRHNQETDIDHYKIYSNDEPTGTFTLIGTSTDNEFVDEDVVNGETYFYAVSAVDRAGQESPELSYENAFDTPRPEGFDVTLNDANTADATSGWDFSAETRRPSGDPATDVYYAFQDGQYLIFVPTDTRIQDAGYVPLVDVDYGPPAGWSDDGVVEAIPGHSYILLTRDNHYSKFEVNSRSATNMLIDWAYQIDPDNPELVRPAP
jgi:hypothetical protein